MFLNTFNKFLISNFLSKKSHAKKIAYVALMTALNIICNSLLEFRTSDVQFSFTILVSIVTGITLGSLGGFIATFLADFIGYLISSWGYVYMPWVGLSTGVMSIIAGVVFAFGGDKTIHLVIKCLITTLLTFILCTVLINSTGFYFYNKFMGFSTAVLDYVKNTFGSGVDYFTYLAYRLIFKGQIINSGLNYALLFIFVPILKKVKVI